MTNEVLDFSPTLLHHWLYSLSLWISSLDIATHVSWIPFSNFPVHKGKQTLGVLMCYWFSSEPACLWDNGEYALGNSFHWLHRDSSFRKLKTSNSIASLLFWWGILFALLRKQTKCGHIGSCGMQMREGGGDVGSAFWLQSKMCSLSLPLSLSVVFFLLPCVSSEWESVCIHEDQLDGIPISAVGFFPSVVLFSAEGTVLFHLNECASSFPLCVCVFIWGCIDPVDGK